MQPALTFTIQRRTCRKHVEQTATAGEQAAAPAAAAVGAGIRASPLGLISSPIAAAQHPAGGAFEATKCNLRASPELGREVSWRGLRGRGNSFLGAMYRVRDGTRSTWCGETRFSAAPWVGSRSSSSTMADPSSQHSGNLSLSPLHPEKPMMGIQYHFPNMRNQNDLLHNPAAQLGPRGRSFSLPHRKLGKDGHV